MATDESVVIDGTPVVPGVAYAPLLAVHQDVPAEAISAFDAGLTVDEAVATYETAADTVAQRLAARSAASSGHAADLLSATAGIARDSGLRSAVRTRLEAGDDLPAALGSAIEEFVTTFTRLGGVMAERVTDLRDVERRLTAEIVGAPEPGVPDPARPSVLVAVDLAPADTAGLDPASVVALVTERGGPTSHTAIISRQLGIPCVVAASGIMGVKDGTMVLVDGAAGTITVAPPEAAAREQAAAEERLRRELASWSGPGATRDGHRVRLLANVHDGVSARAAAQAPVEGVGLFRTEICFLDESVEPPVEVQTEAYAEVLDAFGPERPVVIRTLDAGSDKPLAFANQADEDNPALGVRGLRLAGVNPGLLDRQLEAIRAAARSTGTTPRVMAPMVATVAEARGFADKVHALGLEAGVMIEVPSAAILARRLLEFVDFLSIGTNDLTQYTMAADRTAGSLAHLTDPWQPAVLTLVSIAAEAGRRADRSVGVCGEAAADPDLAAVLVGMGVTSLSMAPAAVAGVGRRLSRSTMQACEEAATAALGTADPVEARAAARAILEI
ncbi:phosphoenolpyruvate--protein phosphotransferase [Solicola gregarius]|uniref:Phosphoenolpyruvate-protein phosphotransferase n=1 Tax=Solicola gregarius TaxID=2908642 RepID=A0AA46YKP6_9ACTN|nr:putative PEP-binding protein [Solicola gregarius]UYM04706.1 PEP-utilizing enzyme [Solicola gregarius]